MSNISQNNRFNKVIKEEIKALETALLNLKEEDINKAIDLIYNVKGRLVVIGLGKSGYIGEKIAASFSSMGTPSYFIHATELFHGDFGRIVSGDVVLLLSHSGETLEVVNAALKLKKLGHKLIAITNHANSSLSRTCSVSLNYEVDKEADHINMAPTNSAIIMLAIGDALMVAVSEMKDYKKSDFKKNHPGGSLGTKD